MMVLVILWLMAVATAANPNSKIIEANNRFAPDLYKQTIKTQSGNIVLSPLSADTVLALLLSGCEGATAQELAKALHLPDDKKQIQTEKKILLGQLQKNDKVTFNIANALFIQKQYKFKDTFLKVATDDFYALSQSLDFAKSQEAANTINKWVENKTHNTIKNLVAPNDLTPSTKLVLVNALRFKGNWSLQFPVSDTQKEDFYKTPNDVVKAYFVHLSKKHFKYYASKDLNAEFLELPFQDDETSMVFVLPRSKNGLSELEKRASDVFDVSVPLESTYISVALPKFHFESRIDLQAPLQNLGANKIFNSGEADLSGIAGKKGDLVVSQVIQKAFIDLNEGGVEATAATYVGVSLTSVITQEPKNFVANRPFIFFIKYKNVIIFAGRVVDPKY